MSEKKNNESTNNGASLSDGTTRSLPLVEGSLIELDATSTSTAKNDDADSDEEELECTPLQPSSFFRRSLKSQTLQYDDTLNLISSNEPATKVDSDASRTRNQQRHYDLMKDHRSTGGTLNLNSSLLKDYRMNGTLNLQLMDCKSKLEHHVRRSSSNESAVKSLKDYRMDGTLNIQLIDCKSKLEHNDYYKRTALPTTTRATTTGHMKQSLKDIAHEFKDNVIIKDRRYHTKTYKSCFIGKEGVDFLVSYGYAETRKDAVKIGRLLQQKPYSLFSHVCNNHDFKDSYLFYHFTTTTTDNKEEDNETQQQQQQKQQSSELSKSLVPKFLRSSKKKRQQKQARQNHKGGGGGEEDIKEKYYNFHEVTADTHNMSNHQQQKQQRNAALQFFLEIFQDTMDFLTNANGDATNNPYVSYGILSLVVIALVLRPDVMVIVVLPIYLLVKSLCKLYYNVVVQNQAFNHEYRGIFPKWFKNIIRKEVHSIATNPQSRTKYYVAAGIVVKNQQQKRSSTTSK